MEKDEKLPTITPQQQLWKFLKTDDQRQLMSDSLRHLKVKSQEDLAIALVAYLRFGAVRHFEDSWLERYFKAMLCFVKVEQAEGRM